MTVSDFSTLNQQFFPEPESREINEKLCFNTELLNKCRSQEDLKKKMETPGAFDPPKAGGCVAVGPADFFNLHGALSEAGQPLRERPRGGLKDLRAPPGNASTITGPAR